MGLRQQCHDVWRSRETIQSPKYKGRTVSYLFILANLTQTTSEKCQRLAAVSLLHVREFNLTHFIEKNPERVAAGLKATVHNPAVSEEAKTRAREKLAEMGVDINKPAPPRAAGKKSHAKEAKGSQTFVYSRGRFTDSISLSSPADISESSEKPLESEATESTSKHGMDLREIESKEMGSEQQLEEHRRLGGYKATLKSTFLSFATCRSIELCTSRSSGFTRGERACEGGVEGP